MGVTFNATGLLNLFAGYSEGSRAPTAIELGCADPESKLRWNVAWFRADNRDDILFVGSEQTGFGYFKNFGKTLRQGLEVDVNSRIWRINLGGGYTFLDPTFQSEEEVNG